MQVALQRITAETSRASEYFTTRELQTMTGQDRSNFATVVMKELVDNALDAAEINGVNPEIIITCNIDQEIKLTVTDNGPGLGMETIKKILNFNIRVSSNSIYRSPTRGAQGNAWKTILGIPGALGGTKPVIIESNGIKHIVRAWADPAGIVRVEHEQGQSDVSTGCSVTAVIPNDDQIFSPWLLPQRSEL
jgi:DNA topoisomerase VI subunit B